MISRQFFKLALQRSSGFSFNSTAFFAKIKEVKQEDQWDEFVVKNSKPVILDFYADWCGPCKKLGPMLEKHAEQNDKFDIVKVNVDHNGDIAGSLNIQSIPTVFLIHKGQPVEQFMGVNEKKLLEFVEKAKKLAEEK